MNFQFVRNRPRPSARARTDGQAMWDPLLAPSCWHGVTTAMFLGFVGAKTVARFVAAGCSALFPTPQIGGLRHGTTEAT
jgi:hypothetical protein